jgi:hypothetical protein
MKKLLFVLLTAVMAFSLMSCESCTNKAEGSNDTNDLVYNVTATAEGQVEFNWFNGGATVDGNATVYQCNDTINKVFANAEDKSVLLNQALESEDSTVVNAAQKVLGMLEVKGVEGNYHLKIVGYVKYGPIILRIDEEYPKAVDANDVNEE